MSIEEKRKAFGAALKTNFEDQSIEKKLNVEGIRQYVKTQEDMLEAFSKKKRPSPDMLGVFRSFCTLCAASCECYEPFEVFMLDSIDVSYSNAFTPSLCRNCKCPAYYHPPIIKELKFPSQLKEGLRNTVLKEDHLNFSGAVIVFDIEFHILDQNELTLRQQEDSLYLLLKHGGFGVVCRSVRVLSSEENEVVGQFRSSVMKTMGFLLNTINKSTNIPGSSKTVKSVLGDKQDKPLLLLCVSSNYTNSQSKLSKFLASAKDYSPTGIKHLYNSSNSTQGFTDCSIFFPEIFTIKKTCVLIPTESFSNATLEIDPVMNFFRMQSMKIKGENVENKDPNKLKIGKVIDILNYNAFGIMSNTQKKIENPKELHLMFSKIMDSARADFLSKFMVTSSLDSNIICISAGKAGIPLMQSLNTNSIEYFSFTSEKDLHTLFSYFHPDLVTSSRVLLIFRPVTVRSGLNKLFLNVFKRNYFIILHEEFRKLSMKDVEVIGKGLNSEELSDLAEFMMVGESQILVLSKLNGLEDAKILSYGSLNGRKRQEKKLHETKSFSIDHELEKNPYKMKLDQDAGLEPRQPTHLKETVHVTHSLAETSAFNISPFSSISESLDLDSIVESQINSNQHHLDLPNFNKKAREIEKLRHFSRYFNIPIHVSSDPISAENEILHFFPNLCLYSDVILLLKPEFLSLEKDFLELLKNMKAKLIRSCTVKNHNAYHITKIAGRFEFSSLFEYVCPIKGILKPENLSTAFVLCAVPDEFEETLSEISPDVKSLSLTDLSTCSDDTLLNICSYILLNTSNEDIINESIEFLINYPDFLHYSIKLNTLQGTSKEIRIRKVREYYLQDSKLELLELFDEYSVISWYYNEIAKVFPRIVPNYYDFKIDPMNESFQATRIYSCCEFKGHIFFKTVAEMMKEHRHREQITKKNRGSMPAFMWGKKLASLAERIESLPCDHIEDFGPIYWNGQGKFLGYYTENPLAFDTQKYTMYIAQLESGWKDYISQRTASQIYTKFEYILKSDAFKQSRAKENMGLVPDSIEFVNLRVFSYKERPDTSKIEYINSKLIAIEELYDKTIKEIDTKDFALLDVFPSKYPKRHMSAGILWLLNVSLKEIDNKAAELNLDPEEYRIMVESMTDGFINNYTDDAIVKGISLLQMEYFLFSIAKAWRLVVYILEIQSKIEQSVLLSSIETAKIKKEEEKCIKQLAFSLETIANINLEYSTKNPESQHLKIGRERYFQHFMLKEYDANLSNPQYPNKIINSKFPIVNPVLQDFIKESLSDVQKTWYNPPQTDKINLRPVPKSAYRYNSMLVKSTKWVTHQRQKKLVKDAVLYLTQSFKGTFNKINLK